jgi:hexosaminidase
MRLQHLMILAGLALSGAPLAATATSDHAFELIPQPAQVTAGAGAFQLREDTPIVAGADPQSVWIAHYLASLLHTSHGWRVPVRAAGAAPPFAPAIELRLDAKLPQAPEAYELDVSPQRIVVAAGARAGLFYGAVTLWQLASVSAEDGTIALPGLHIGDAPRFRWRGLMLDSARHFQSPQFIRRYIDWMALHKLNVLGWHLTDDQGWRLQIRKYPRLTEVGAWRVEAGAARKDIDPATHRPRRYGGFYSQAEVRRIVAYAAERNVTIVPEIDIPGHASAAIVAYPRLGVLERAPSEVPADWGGYPNLFNVEESTFAFLEDVLAEVMQLFPGEYIHVGGDEAVKDQWRASARVQARMRELGVADEEALQGYFTARMGAYLHAHGRRLIGWDEILSGGLPADAAVMSWRGVTGAITAAARGHDTVLAPAPTLYLDFRQGSGPEEPPGRGTVIPLRAVYEFDPLPAALSGYASHVLGLQANLWTEHVRTEERAAYMSWPRAAALAEVAWSAPATRSWPDFLRRLPAEFARADALGMPAARTVFAPARTVGALERHMSQDLTSCTGQLVLNLEDDAPLHGQRAVFLIDIENPCWVFPAVDLSQVSGLQAAVGQLPFNFQIGKDIEAIHLAAPQTPDGELEVYLDQCAGTPAARLPLASAVHNDAVTVLPAAPLPRLSGTHALCLRFAQHGLDPMWALDWVQLAP